MVGQVKNWFAKEWRSLVLWLLFVWLVFGYSLFFDFFVFDDHLHFYDNSQIGVRSIEDLFYFWKNSLTPIIFFCWQMISLVFGNDSPIAFRVFNFFLMGGCSFVLFTILKRIVANFSGAGKENYKYLPYFATAFFVLHPVQVESVVWVSSGRTLLATFLALLSVRMFQLSRDFPSVKVYEVLVVVFFILGMLSKPSIVMLPFLLVGLQLIDGSNWKESLKSIWPLLFIGACVGVLHSIDILTPHLKQLPVKSRVLIFLDSIIYYLKMTFLPFDSYFNYGRNPERILFEFDQGKAQFLLVPFTFLFFLVAAFFTKRLKPLSLTFILFFILIFPNMGMISYDFQNISTVANRYLNFPLVSLCIGLCFLGKSLFDNYKVTSRVFSGGVVMLLILSSLSVNLGKQWRDSDRLLSKVTRNDMFPNLISLGLYYNRIGSFKKAEEFLIKAWDINPMSLSPSIGLIDLYQKYSYVGNIEVFLERLEKLKIIVPANKSLELAILYFKVGSYRQAMNYARISFQSNIDDDKARALFNESSEAIKKEKLSTYLKLIELYLGENRVQEAYRLTLEAVKELGKLPELNELLNSVFKAQGQK